ncbi:Protein phosphatase 2C (PP2C)-like domain [Pseudocohnilembus persalinus]|uniref:protein-serine/threonine phosphatase n=1 Tax=Pseudocohnilembus persalinus TaxID=266149 RepID=A0A0V0QSE4_PSEPJ|nr:Protein phosphatase 2C (PP2C)-like domain [Pseudocohnilembus persalinus]|eukprot:KRX04821.1 Protein phosphatase 2C (PP2C)-like domain [Pseudocohnilembus persalinus]
MFNISKREFGNVLDGHGGPQCGNFVKINILNIFCKFFKIEIQQNPKSLSNKEQFNETIFQIMVKTFYQVDIDFYNAFQKEAVLSGATGNVVIIFKKRLYSFYIGDCKSFICQKKQITILNQNHIPTRPDELKRLQNAGGDIKNGRLNGKVVISRCFGQFEFKKQEDYLQIQQEDFSKQPKLSLISVFPECVIYDINQDQDDFLFLSTDGIYEQIKEIEISNLITQYLQNQEGSNDLGQVLQNLIDLAYKKSQKIDNLAIILVLLQRP